MRDEQLGERFDQRRGLRVERRDGAKAKGDAATRVGHAGDAHLLEAVRGGGGARERRAPREDGAAVTC